ncbi:hypothetical protein CAEBREN_26209 [Caenorhabditis brenneri]|uniref:Uncharacterized protein n=1 Tax=Caenorhabditis brenneri TaxID=135651 RepID=G0N8T1_CAEBE|nr:hypothetical protein CAEBREN_26209 [Caenorhabditis brenneri]
MTGRPRNDWYQTDTDVVLTISKRGVPLEACRVTLSKDNNLIVKQDEDILFEGQLYSEIKKDEITVQCTPSKIELRLPKFSRCERWNSLLKDGQGGPVSAPLASTKAPVATSSSSSSKKNWDAIEKQAVKDEEDEKLEGDAAVNKMFRSIYDNASDDVRRAMMKSYSESNGTVLSTNWEEISKQKTETQPPACMEFKKFQT